MEHDDLDPDDVDPDEKFLHDVERGVPWNEPYEPENRESAGAINWNLLSAEEAELEWADLDAWVSWLRVTFGLSPAVLPPYWHRHDELIWELSALHTHWLACYDETASPSAPIAWMRDFAEARHRLRDWVAQCGTRLDRDRPTRMTIWPGEPPRAQSGEVEILDRSADFDDFVRADIRGRRALENAIRSELA